MYLLNIFGPMSLFIFFNIQKVNIKSIIHNSIAMISLKSLYPRWESNPGDLKLVYKYLTVMNKPFGFNGTKSHG
jgi:hypothetical protein